MCFWASVEQWQSIDIWFYLYSLLRNLNNLWTKDWKCDNRSRIGIYKSQALFGGISNFLVLGVLCFVLRLGVVRKHGIVPKSPHLGILHLKDCFHSRRSLIGRLPSSSYETGFSISLTTSFAAALSLHSWPLCTSTPLEIKLSDFAKPCSLRIEKTRCSL